MTRVKRSNSVGANMLSFLGGLGKRIAHSRCGERIMRLLFIGNMGKSHGTTISLDDGSDSSWDPPLTAFTPDSGIGTWPIIKKRHVRDRQACVWKPDAAKHGKRQCTPGYARDMNYFSTLSNTDC